MGPPLVTLPLHRALLAARQRAPCTIEASLDLGRSHMPVHADAATWSCAAGSYPYFESCRDRTVYYWTGHAFAPVARYGTAFIKLVPTEWGPPTFEIDGIKMLPTAQVSPYDDACAKIERVRPRGAIVLDTCGGLGYFAARVLKPRGRLFHYTGAPNRLSAGRDVPREVAKRLREQGFATELAGDGVLAVKGGTRT